MHVTLKILKALAFGVFGAALVCAVSQTVGYHTLLRIQNTIDDSHFDIWKKRQPVDDGIVIVDADTKSNLMLGNFKRWPRRHFTAAINRLNADGARLVFLDVMFMRGGLASENRALADTIMSGGNVIIGYYLQIDPRSLKKKPTDSVSGERLVGRSPSDSTRFLRAYNMNLPIPELVFSARKLGFTNCIPDPDGTLRRIPLFIGYRRSTLSSASLQMWMYLKGVKASSAVVRPDGARFGDTFIPTDRYGFMRLNFRNAGHEHPRISFQEVLNGRFAPGTFRGKAVMVGSSSELLKDIKRVPGHRSLPGVEIHAAALSTLLSGKFIRVAPVSSMLALSIVAGVVTGFFLIFFPLFQALAASIAVPFALYAWAAFRFVSSSELVNITVPSAVTIFMVVMMVIHRFVETHTRSDG